MIFFVDSDFFVDKDFFCDIKLVLSMGWFLVGGDRKSYNHWL